MFARWKKIYDQPRQHIKKQWHYFANKGPSTQSYVFSSSHVWLWESDHKESWAPKNWCFWTVVLEKTLESPLDNKEIQAVHPKGNQSWMFIGRTDTESEAPILGPPDGTHLIWRSVASPTDPLLLMQINPFCQNQILHTSTCSELLPHSVWTRRWRWSVLTVLVSQIGVIVITRVSSNILVYTPLHNMTLLLFPLNRGVYFSTLNLSWPHDLLGPIKFHRRTVLGFGASAFSLLKGYPALSATCIVHSRHLTAAPSPGPVPSLSQPKT